MKQYLWYFCVEWDTCVTNLRLCQRTYKSCLKRYFDEVHEKCGFTCLPQAQILQQTPLANQLPCMTLLLNENHLFFRKRVTVPG